MGSNRWFPSGDLIKGTALLTVAGIFTRILGLLNRMCLARLIGAEGLGLFQMVIPFYALLAVTVSLGLPGAVAKMVADRHALGDEAGQERVRRLALRLAVPVAVFTALGFWVFLSLPLEFVPDRRIIPSLRMMPPAFIFVALSAIMRSYFQGRSNMLPLALSQVSEQAVRVGVGLAAALLLLPRGLEAAAAGIVIGIVAGEVCCYAALLPFDRRERERSTLPGLKQVTGRPVLRTMVCLSFPILIIRLSTAVTQTVESLLIPARLQVAGFSPSEATALFGQLTGMALPLLFLPTVLIIPMNTALVPAVAGAVTLGLRKRILRLVGLSLGGSALIGLLSAAALFLFAPVLAEVIYGDVSAAPLVACLAPIAPLAYMQFTTASILHGFGRPGVAVANDLAGTALSLVIIYYLTADPAHGIFGVAWGYITAFVFITLLDGYFIYRYLDQ